MDLWTLLTCPLFPHRGEKIWMDEGAGGFIPSTMNPNDTYRTTANDDIVS